MLQSLQNYYVTDQCIPINLTGLASGVGAFSSTICNTTYGWEKLRIMVRLRTGTGLSSIGTVRLVFHSSVNGVWFDGVFSGAQFVDYAANLDDTAYNFGWSPNLDLAGPYWALEVVNNTGADFNNTASNFTLWYAASKHMLVDRFDYFYKPTGKIAFAGDATETRFPFVTEMTGGLGISGVIRDFTFLPAGKFLRNQISGLASVETFPLPYTEGRLGFSGTFGGPTSNP